MKESAKSWVIDQSTLSEAAKMQQKIFEILNKLTLDNYEDLREDLIRFLKDQNYSKYMAEFIVDKAINEKMYTHLFCNLIKYLSDQSNKLA